MKLVSFFLLSLFVHAAALAFPVTLNPRTQQEAFRVVLLEIEPTGAGDGNGAEPLPQPGRSIPTVHKPSTFPPALSSARVRDSRARALTEKAIAKPEKAANDAEDRLTLFSPGSEPVVDHMNLPDGAPDGAAHGNATGYGEQTGESAGNGLGAGIGMGFGVHGAGVGQGHGAATAAQITQASFRHAPPPEYPEAARKNGKEGRVLLRVLVDEQGKSKTVEISLSSGSDLLDQAAAEAVKHWRFSPARHGDTPMPSWVRIPVDFRLRDSR